MSRSEEVAVVRRIDDEALELLEAAPDVRSGRVGRNDVLAEDAQSVDVAAADRVVDPRDRAAGRDRHRHAPRQLEAATGTPFNSVLLNYYRSGQDAMGWHSDDEPELGVHAGRPRENQRAALAHRGAVSTSSASPEPSYWPNMTNCCPR